jgi:predicted dehydrogenase
VLRGVLIGAGGFAAAWAHEFLPRFADRLAIVGIADIDPVALGKSADTLEIPEAGRFVDFRAMLDAVEADACFIVIPPVARVEAVRAAAAHGLAVLCEKPMAASWADTLTIAEIVRENGIPFAVMQNYREQPRIRALKRVLQRADLGAINLIECRFAVNYTIETAGGAFRHQIPDAFIYEGAEHHLDQLRNLTGADAAWVMGAQWGQPWSTFTGPTCAALIIGMTNGVIVQYEMNHVERGPQAGWRAEYYRISTEGGSVILDADNVVRIVRDSPDGEFVEEFYPDPTAADGHDVVIVQFLDWLTGGDPPVSVLDDNLRTMALTFAAVEATHSGRRIAVPALLADVPGAVTVPAGKR